MDRHLHADPETLQGANDLDRRQALALSRENKGSAKHSGRQDTQAKARVTKAQSRFCRLAGNGAEIKALTPG